MLTVATGSPEGCWPWLSTRIIISFEKLRPPEPAQMS